MEVANENREGTATGVRLRGKGKKERKKGGKKERKVGINESVGTPLWVWLNHGTADRGKDVRKRRRARRGGEEKRGQKRANKRESSAGSRWLVRPLANGSPNTSTPAASHPLGSWKPVGGRGALYRRRAPHFTTKSCACNRAKSQTGRAFHVLLPSRFHP